MIGICPRTSLILDELILGLNEFLDQIDLSKSYVALSVFDVARGYVDQLLFTQNEVRNIKAMHLIIFLICPMKSNLREKFKQLRNYTLRDDTCNVKESLAAKFNAFSSYRFGLEWDRRHFVVFTASGDVVNFASEQGMLGIFA
jgi:hypothetical protein